VDRDAVLVIDDDSDFREAVRLLLEETGVTVLEAPDCAAGLAVLDREGARVGVVLLDYWMPGMTAAACVRALTERAGADVEIVLVTAAANPAGRAAELGFARYISKPFAFDQLERVVNRARVRGTGTASRSAGSGSP
jgi:DNA-binding NtrC family response regulator